MKFSIVTTVFAAVLALGVVAPSVVQAANARHPYKNVNRANDRGNRTGDAAVERLNQAQLDQVRPR